jgi:hypothetical protein
LVKRQFGTTDIIEKDMYWAHATRESVMPFPQLPFDDPMVQTVAEELIGARYHEIILALESGDIAQLSTLPPDDPEFPAVVAGCLYPLNLSHHKIHLPSEVPSVEAKPPRVRRSRVLRIQELVAPGSVPKR